MGSVLTAALALAALPGLAGSRAPSAMEPVPAVAFQSLSVPASETSSALSIAGLDGGYVSAGFVQRAAPFIEPGDAPETGPTRRAGVDQPDPGSHSSRKPPKYTLRGEATFYDNGTTAMRLPRGTIVIICAAAAAASSGSSTTTARRSRPGSSTSYRPDFFEICGCPSWSGVVDVTVYVY